MFLLQPVRVFLWNAEGDQVSHVHHAHAPRRGFFAQNLCGGNDLQRQVIATTGERHLRVFSVVCAGPTPDRSPNATMFDGFLHCEPLRHRLLADDDQIDVIGRAEAMVRGAEQAVGIGWQINPVGLPFFGEQIINKSRPLMRIAVVVLPPCFGRE